MTIISHTFSCIRFLSINFCHKAQPHGAMLHTHDGMYQCPCDVAKSHAMLCDAFSNMLVILLPILENLGYLLFDFQMVSIILMGIPSPVM